MFPHWQLGETVRFTRYRSALRSLAWHRSLVCIMFHFLSPTKKYDGVVIISRLDFKVPLKYETEGQCLRSCSRVSQLRIVEGKKDLLVVSNLKLGGVKSASLRKLYTLLRLYGVIISFRYSGALLWNILWNRVSFRLSRRSDSFSHPVSK